MFVVNCLLGTCNKVCWFLELNTQNTGIIHFILLQTIEHWHITDLILRLCFLLELFPFRGIKWFPFHARTNGNEKEHEYNFLNIPSQNCSQ
jgi:hypothetical protein